MQLFSRMLSCHRLKCYQKSLTKNNKAWHNKRRKWTSLKMKLIKEYHLAFSHMCFRFRDRHATWPCWAARKINSKAILFACQRQKRLERKQRYRNFYERKKSSSTKEGEKHDTWRQKFESNLGMPCGKATHAFFFSSRLI